MGKLWNDKSKTSVLACYENNTIYKGDGIFKEAIGSYDTDVVKDNYGKIVGKFNSNCVNSPEAFSTTSYCNAKHHTIYSGGSSNNSLAVYDDNDVKGACAAALLYFGLHNKINEIPNTNINSKQTGINTASNANLSFLGVVVIAVIILFVSFFLTYLTDAGARQIFHNEWGRVIFLMCLVLCICSSVYFIRTKTTSLVDLCTRVPILYLTVIYLFQVISAIIDGIVSDRLDFGTLLIILIGGALTTIGVSSIFIIVQIPVLYIIGLFNNQKKKQK